MEKILINLKVKGIFLKIQPTTIQVANSDYISWTIVLVLALTSSDLIIECYEEVQKCLCSK